MALVQQAVTLISVVDPSCVFVEFTTFDKIVEAVCNCAASGSCLSPEVYSEMKKTQKHTLETCTRNLRAGNGLPIVVEGNMKVSIYLGSKLLHHGIASSKSSEADCSFRWNFLERHKCDPLFSKKESKLDSTHSLPLYPKKFCIP